MQEEVLCRTQFWNTQTNTHTHKDRWDSICWWHKTHLKAEFHETDLDISGHSIVDKTLVYNQIKKVRIMIPHNACFVDKRQIFNQILTKKDSAYTS